MSGRRRRGGLADLIGEVGAAPQERVVEEPRHEVAPMVREEARRSRPEGGGEAATPAREPEREEVGAPGRPLPRYLALQRKEARLRGDQVDALASLARRTNRRKTERGGERITENTLIRVAVDWLLSQAAYVEGSSEVEIRHNLGVGESRSDIDA